MNTLGIVSSVDHRSPGIKSGRCRPVATENFRLGMPEMSSPASFVNVKLWSMRKFMSAPFGMGGDVVSRSYADAGRSPLFPHAGAAVRAGSVALGDSCPIRGRCGAGGFSSGVTGAHGKNFCPNKPLNATQLI